MTEESNTCAVCGEGRVVETIEKNHQVTIAGNTITIDEAIVGRCDKCNVANYAFRKDLKEGYTK